MDSELYVPISVVASFNKVKAWNTDYDTIVRALKSIPSVIVDETNTKVKPNISTQRTTIILRDVDSSATKEVIASDACKSNMLSLLDGYSIFLNMVRIFWPFSDPVMRIYQSRISSKK
jgi:hypothetical protein